MGSQNRLVQFGIVIGLTVILQLLLVAADLRQTPVRTAEEFARNFFYLDAQMRDQLCTALAEDTVDDYLYEMNQRAAQRGFSIKYIRQLFTHLHIQIIAQDETSAQVHLTGQTRTAVNPVFMVIGKLFHLGEYHPVDMTLELVKEQGQWRVCGEVAGLNL